MGAELEAPLTTFPRRAAELWGNECNDGASGRPADPKPMRVSNVACNGGDGATFWLRTRLSRSSAVVFAGLGLRGAAERGGGNAETGQVDVPVNLVYHQRR